ncbi:MAG: hypothetical protein E4H36_14595, partial [Spirochaetales bacterium]
LITVYKAYGQPEAEIIKGRLNVENIPVMLKYESLGNVYGLTIDGLGQVEVLVPSKYAEQAKEILGHDADMGPECLDATEPEQNPEL